MSGGDFNLYRYVLNDPVTLIDPFGLDVWVYIYRAAGSGYGHVGLIMPNDNGTYTRFSQGADNPNAPPYELIIPLHDAVVNKKNIPNLKMPGAEIVRISTKNNNQIQKAIVPVNNSVLHYMLGSSNLDEIYLVIAAVFL